MNWILAQSNLWAGVDITHELFLFSPMIALVCTMLAVVTCPIVLNRSSKTIATVAGIGVIVTAILCFRVAGTVAGAGADGLSPGGIGGMLIADNLSIGFQFILLLFLVGVMGLWCMGSGKSEQNAPEFFVLLIGSALGMVLMTSTQHLLMIVIAIEVASLPSYALVGFDKRDRVGAEASLKYMVFGAVSAAIMLYGASLLYGLAGSLNFAEIAAYVVAPNLALESSVDASVSAATATINPLLTGLALFCFFGGVAFKISAVPFHFWCPDAFEGARIEVTTWLSVVSKAAGLILLARLTLTLCDAVGSAHLMALLKPAAWALAIVAAVTCTIGNFAAYRQESVKRLLAYSSIAHAGYMMMATVVFLHPDAGEYGAGITALLIYIVIYLFMNLGAFGVTALVLWDTGSDKIDAFNGLIRRAPWLAVPMVICLMSLVGLPPLAGFLGKWWILLALGDMSDTPMATIGWFLIITAVVNTLISLYYYLRVVVRMTLQDDGRPLLRAPIGGLAIVNVCGAALLLLFILAQPLKSFGLRYSQHLFQARVDTPVAARSSEWPEGETRTPAQVATLTDSESGE